MSGQGAAALLSLIIPGISASLSCRRLGAWGSRAANLLVGLVVYVLLFLIPVHIVATLQLFGLFKAFSLFHVVAFDGLVLLAVLMWHFSRPAEPRPSDAKRSFALFIKGLPTPVILSLGIVAACYLAFALDLLTSYPYAAGDGIYYHLPLAVRWLQDGSLGIPPSKTWRYSMPGNGEIPMMVLLGVGWHALALLFNLMGALILVCATYVIALKCGASRAAAVSAALILASVPIVTFQAFQAYTDLYGASFFMAGVAIFLYRHSASSLAQPDRYLVSLSLSALACGLALGTKAGFYVYGGLFFIAVYATVVVERHRHRKSLVWLAALTLLMMLAPNIFWSGRAVSSTGNPLYPIKIELLGYTVFDGYPLAFMRVKDEYLRNVRTRAEWLIYPWTEYDRWGRHYYVDSGLGASFATFVPLGVFYGAYLSIRKRRQNGRDLKGILAWSVLVGSVAWWVALGQEPRFAIPLMALAGVLATPLLDLFLQSGFRLFGVLLVCSFATTCLIAASSPLRNLHVRIREGKWTRAEIYKYPPILDDLPEGSTVLNLGRFHLNNFALAGKHLSNRVIPFFEQPLERRKEGWLDPHITETFLCQNEVHYIVQRERDHLVGVEAEGTEDQVPYPKYLVPGIRLELVYDDDVWSDSARKNPWRVWRVMQQCPAERSASLLHVAEGAQPLDRLRVDLSRPLAHVPWEPRGHALQPGH